jgi:hypothetical protein
LSASPTICSDSPWEYTWPAPGVTLDDEVLDRIDEIAPPGTDAGPNDVAYTPPAVSSVDLRRRPVVERSAA